MRTLRLGEAVQETWKCVLGLISIPALSFHGRPEECLAGREERQGTGSKHSQAVLRRQENIRVCIFSQTPLNNFRFISPSCQLMKQVEQFQHPAELCISSHVKSAVWRHLFCFHLFQSPDLSRGGRFFQWVPVWQGGRGTQWVTQLHTNKEKLKSKATSCNQMQWNRPLI